MFGQGGGNNLRGRIPEGAWAITIDLGGTLTELLTLFSFLRSGRRLCLSPRGARRPSQASSQVSDKGGQNNRTWADRTEF